MKDISANTSKEYQVSRLVLRELKPRAFGMRLVRSADQTSAATGSKGGLIWSEFKLWRTKSIM